MKQEFNWRDYDNYNEWLHDVLETLTESIEEKDKEIERLKEEYMILQNASDEVEEEKDKEIERLKEELKYTIPIVEHNKTITKHLKEIERLNNIINEYEDRFKMIKKIVEDNILEELNSLEYSMMMSTIYSVCDGKSGFLSLGVDKE